jgi:hypothetical protein
VTGERRAIPRRIHGARLPIYMYYNFARPHATLTKDAGGRPTTPAMAAGIENRVWTVRDIAALLD